LPSLGHFRRNPVALRSTRIRKGPEWSPKRQEDGKTVVTLMKKSLHPVSKPTSPSVPLSTKKSCWPSPENDAVMSGQGEGTSHMNILPRAVTRDFRSYFDQTLQSWNVLHDHKIDQAAGKLYERGRKSGGKGLGKNVRWQPENRL